MSFALRPGSPALAANPSFINVCTGLGVNLPVLQPVAGVADGLLTGLLAPVGTALNATVGSINTNLQQTLSGKPIGLGVLDPTTGSFVSVPSNQCNLSASGLAVDNNVGLSLGGGQISGLGGTGSTPATAGDSTSIALGNGATTAVGVPRAVALGINASSTAANSVALGAGSLAARGALSAYTAFGLTGLQTSTGEVSFGSAAAPRQLTNVAAGTVNSDAATVGQLRGAILPLQASSRLSVAYTPDANGNPTALVDLASNPALPIGTTQSRLTGVAPGSLSAASLDAVNGSQLFATGASTATRLGGGSIYDPTTGQVTAPQYTIRSGLYNNVGSALAAVDTALSSVPTHTATFTSNNIVGAPAAVASGADASAGGFGASATGGSSTVVGNSASDGGVANSTVLGNGARVTAGLQGTNVALGQGAVVSTGAVTNYSAFGLAAPQVSSGEVSVGSAVAQKRVTNVAAGAATTDAVNVAQLRGSIQDLGVSVGAVLGGGSTYDPVTGTVGSPSYTIRGTTYPNVSSALNALASSMAGTGVGAQLYFQANSSQPSAQALSGESIALGPVAVASAPSAIAIGNGATASGLNSVALGAGSTDDGVANVVSVGSANAKRRITNLADATDLSDAVTLGQLRGSTSGVGMSVASLAGGGSTYDDVTGKVTAPSYTVGTSSYNNVGAAITALNGSVAAGPVQYATAAAPTTVNPGVTSNDVTLVGANASLPVGLHNVAAGTLTAGSTDAATAGQLYASSQSLASFLAGGSTYNTTTGQISNPTYTIAGNSYTTIGGALNALASLSYGGTTTPSPSQINFVNTEQDGNPGPPLETGNDSVAAGAGARAMGNQATAIGVSAQALYDGATAIGQGAIASADPTTAVGTGAMATANEASAFGAYAAASGVNSTALGRSAAAAGTNSVAVGYGASATGNNSVALGVNSSDGGLANVVSVGAVGAERRITNVAAGTLSATSTDAVNGSQLNQTNTQVASLGHASVQYATDGNGGTLSSVTLATDQGGPVIIHNLAPGVAANDAVTFGQLQGSTVNSVQYTTVNGVKTNTIALAGGNPGAVTITNLAAGVAASDAVNVGQLQASTAGLVDASRAYTDQQVSNLAVYTRRQISQARSDAAGGTALALAATGLRYEDRPGKTSLSGATSYYHGQMGLAFGIGQTSEDGRARVNAAVTASPTMTKPDIGAVVGASVTLN